MNHSFIRWTSACWFLFAAIASDAQDTRSDPNHFGLSFNLGLNIKADFRQASAAGSALGGLDLPGRGHTYEDGYVHVDSSHDSGGLTWNWGYQNSSQVNAGADTIAFHSTVVSTAPQETGASDDPQLGFALTYGRDLGHFGRATWGVEGAFAFTDLHINDGRAFQSSVSQITDTYSFGGITPPGAPYSGGFQGPGPLLSDSPSRSVAVENSFGSGTLDGNLFALRLGPFIDVPLGSRFSVQFGGGLAVGIADTTFSFDATTGVNSLHEQGSTSGTDSLVGGYVSGRFAFLVTSRVSIFAGVLYETLGDSTRQVAGRAARLDLGNSVFISLGAGLSF